MRTLLVILLSCFLTTTSYAQQTRRQRLDSLYNDPFFYPTVSAVLLPKGFVEINNAAALLTANRFFTDQARPEDLNARVSSFSNLLQLTYGVSATSRLNIGVDLLYSAFRLDLDPKASPWKVFGQDSALARNAGLNTVGLRFRWKPLVYNRRLVLQGSLYQPVRQVASSQVNARLQAIYIFELSRKLFLYAQAGVAYSFPKPLLAGTFSVPATAIFQYQLRPTLGLLGVVGSNLTVIGSERGKEGQTAFGTQAGAGIQYQASLRFGVTGFYTRYLMGRNTSAYDTMNLAIRVII